MARLRGGASEGGLRLSKSEPPAGWKRFARYRVIGTAEVVPFREAMHACSRGEQPVLRQKAPQDDGA